MLLQLWINIEFYYILLGMYFIRKWGRCGRFHTRAKKSRNVLYCSVSERGMLKVINEKPVLYNTTECRRTCTISDSDTLVRSTTWLHCLRSPWRARQLSKCISNHSLRKENGYCYSTNLYLSLFFLFFSVRTPQAVILFVAPRQQNFEKKKEADNPEAAAPHDAKILGLIWGRI